MCFKSYLSSPGHRARRAAAGHKKNAKGKLRLFTPALSAAVMLGVTQLAGATADAASFTEPGATVGLAVGAPLPEGVYFTSDFSDGSFRGVDDKKSDLSVIIPAIVWSTPWQMFGARVWGVVAAPHLSFGLPAPSETAGPIASNAGRDFMTMYNPFAGAGLAWDLGGGWGFSYLVGGYAPVDNELRLLGNDIWVLNERAALSYTGNKWNLTAHVIHGLTGNGLQTGQRGYPDYLNTDLTATKTLGQWETGVVAFYSTDLENFAYGAAQCGGPSSTRIAPKCEQAQFAAGGLIGYAFTGITTQLLATTDLWTHNYLNQDGSKSYETRVWARVIVPLWTAPVAEAPLK